jgi:hypothetical protein
MTVFVMTEFCLLSIKTAMVHHYILNGRSLEFLKLYLVELKTNLEIFFSYFTNFFQKAKIFKILITIQKYLLVRDKIEI